MRGAADGRDVPAGGKATAVAAVETGRTGVSTEAEGTDVSLILPCPLLVLGTTREAQTGRPLGDLLRRIGYL